jgi:drug/metabolite transporter (DMT)-like permease
MPQLPASLIGLLLLLQPALSFLFDVVLFDRPTRTLDWVGVALSLIGIFIGSHRKPAPAAEPAVVDA